MSPRFHNMTDWSRFIIGNISNPTKFDQSATTGGGGAALLDFINHPENILFKTSPCLVRMHVCFYCKSLI